MEEAVELLGLHGSSACKIARRYGVAEREEVEEWPRFIDHALNGRPAEQTVEIGCKRRLAAAERVDDRCIEKSRCRSAIGKREIIARCPAMRRELLFNHRIGSGEGPTGVLDTIGIGLTLRPNAVG